jgi:hypothetical protein
LSSTGLASESVIAQKFNMPPEPIQFHILTVFTEIIFNNNSSPSLSSKWTLSSEKYGRENGTLVSHVVKLIV